MKVLVACEFSGRVREAFKRRGHDAWSCDLLDSDIPGQHIKADVRTVLGEPWDLLIAHPPCTYLAVSGARWFREREREQRDALLFVRQLMFATWIPKRALENPVSVISTKIAKPTQIIQPWMFGHSESKATCLWLTGLPQLVPTKIIHPTQYGCRCGARFAASLGKYGCLNCGGDSGAARLIWDNNTPSGQNRLGPSEHRAKERSVTYQGIADAMADQWG